MRWGHHISPVMMAPLRSAARCLIALLALGSPSWAREPGKSDPKATGTKPDNAKPDTAKESIEWKPDKKLDWDKFKGGKPKKADHDAETNHGQKDKEQQEWAEKIAKNLGQPVPKAPPAPAAPKDGADDGSDKTPKAEKPAACKDCEAAEAERKKKLADLKTQISALNTEHSTLFKQVDAIQRDIDAANAEKGKAKTDAAKKAADGKIKAAEGKQAPIKTKMEEGDRKRTELDVWSRDEVTRIGDEGL